VFARVYLEAPFPQPLQARSDGLPGNSAGRGQHHHFFSAAKGKGAFPMICHEPLKEIIEKNFLTVEKITRGEKQLSGYFI
jgi:hypothetical protein